MDRNRFSYSSRSIGRLVLHEEASDKRRGTGSAGADKSRAREEEGRRQARCRRRHSLQHCNTAASCAGSCSDDH